MLPRLAISCGALRRKADAIAANGFAQVGQSHLVQFDWLHIYLSAAIRRGKLGELAPQSRFRRKIACVHREKRRKRASWAHSRGRDSDRLEPRRRASAVRKLFLSPMSNLSSWNEIQNRQTTARPSAGRRKRVCPAPERTISLPYAFQQARWARIRKLDPSSKSSSNVHNPLLWLIAVFPKGE